MPIDHQGDEEQNETTLSLLNQGFGIGINYWQENTSNVTGTDMNSFNGNGGSESCPNFDWQENVTTPYKYFNQDQETYTHAEQSGLINITSQLGQDSQLQIGPSRRLDYGRYGQHHFDNDAGTRQQIQASLGQAETPLSTQDTFSSSASVAAVEYRGSFLRSPTQSSTGKVFKHSSDQSSRVSNHEARKRNKEAAQKFREKKKQRESATVSELRTMTKERDELILWRDEFIPRETKMKNEIDILKAQLEVKKRETENLSTIIRSFASSSNQQSASSPTSMEAQSTITETGAAGELGSRGTGNMRSRGNRSTRGGQGA